MIGMAGGFNMEKVICIEELTKSFKGDKGIFDLNFSVIKGEIFGIFGIKDSGKSTVLASIQGNIKPDKGKCSILGLDTYQERTNVKKISIYIPEGGHFANKGIGISYILNQIDSNHSNKVILIDEPYKEIDSCGKNLFKDMINKLKKQEKAIVICSDNYKELEQICDRIILLHHGKYINTVVKIPFDSRTQRIYRIGFHRNEDYELFISQGYHTIFSKNDQYKQVILKINNTKVSNLLRELEGIDIRNVEFIPYQMYWYYAQSSEKVH